MGELYEYFIVLAAIEDTNDPLKMGRVRCHIPGILDSSSIDKDKLPWIRPYCMNAYQSFSMPEEGQLIWVLSSKTNINEYWWFPYFDLKEQAENFLNSNYNNYPDIFHSRDKANAQFTFDATNGYKFQLPNGSFNLKSNSFSINSGNYNMNINGETGDMVVQNGDGNEVTRGACGQKLSDNFKQLSNLFSQLITIAEPDTHCAKLIPALEDIKSKLDEMGNIDNISFEHFRAN